MAAVSVRTFAKRVCGPHCSVHPSVVVYNNDGELELLELGRFLRQIGRKSKRSEVQKLLELGDLDGNSRLSVGRRKTPIPIGMNFWCRKNCSGAK